MTKVFRIILLKTLLFSFVVAAQAQNGAGQTASDLRAQLTDVEARQSALEDRSRQLDEELKPENIERSLALTGSTKPEELREQRRRELAKEKESVRLQLDQLAASRTRLEAAIATADAESYRRSALPAQTNTTIPSQANTGAVQATSPAQKKQQRRRNARRARPRRRKT